MKPTKKISKTARRTAMKACAAHHKITKRSFRVCVRKKLGTK